MALDPDALPERDSPRGRCPRCGHIVGFQVLWTQNLDRPDGKNRAAGLECMSCNKDTVVIEEMVKPGAPYMRPEYRAIHWWPTPGADDLDPEVPGEVASAFGEGMRALSVRAPRAAVVMFRGMLAFLVQDKGSQEAKSKNSLFKRLEAMAQDGTLHPSLVDWAKEIRVIGNAGAHPDELGPVSEEEARDLSRLCRQMISVVYEVPARIARSRSADASA